MSLFQRFRNVKVLVFGDVMLDRFWWGTVERISPEAPVPVVRMARQTYTPGGAANVAANVAGLGATPFLVGAVGCDPESADLAGVLEDRGIASANLLKFKGRPTIVKTRIVAHNQQVVRVDQETLADLSPDEEELVWAQVSRLLPEVDIVVVSDYAKNLVTAGIMSRIVSSSKKLGKMLLVDPKGRDYSKYFGATLITPNRREAADACNFDHDAADLVNRAGERLLSELDLQAVLITLSEEGMALFRPGVEPTRLPAAAREIYDVTGAGDTVIASMGVALGAGLDFGESSMLANAAAGVVVGQLGTAAISSEQLAHVIKELAIID